MALNTLTCRYPLPDKDAQQFTFQTYSFKNGEGQYIITEEGKLLVTGSKQDPMLVQHQGEVVFSTSKGSREEDTLEHYAYSAIFKQGKLQEIRRLSPKNL